MIAHHYPRVNAPSGLLARLGERLQPDLVVQVIRVKSCAPGFLGPSHDKRRRDIQFELCEPLGAEEGWGQGGVGGVGWHGQRIEQSPWPASQAGSGKGAAQARLRPPLPVRNDGGEGWGEGPNPANTSAFVNRTALLSPALF